MKPNANEAREKTRPFIDDREKVQNRKKWRKPELEDVSGKVMAQPYIRFT